MRTRGGREPGPAEEADGSPAEAKAPTCCDVCGATVTPLWRKVAGKNTCNACGLRHKRHGSFGFRSRKGSAVKPKKKAPGKGKGRGGKKPRAKAVKPKPGRRRSAAAELEAAKIARAEEGALPQRVSVASSGLRDALCHLDSPLGLASPPCLFDPRASICGFGLALPAPPQIYRAGVEAIASDAERVTDLEALFPDFSRFLPPTQPGFNSPPSLPIIQELGPSCDIDGEGDTESCETVSPYTSTAAALDDQAQSGASRATTALHDRLAAAAVGAACNLDGGLGERLYPAAAAAQAEDDGGDEGGVEGEEGKPLSWPPKASIKASLQTRYNACRTNVRSRLREELRGIRAALTRIDEEISRRRALGEGDNTLSQLENLPIPLPLVFSSATLPWGC